MSVVEMKILRWINEYTWKDKNQNEKICLKIGVALIDEKMREKSLKIVWLFREKRLMHQ